MAEIIVLQQSITHLLHLLPGGELSVKAFEGIKKRDNQ
jgi:hypothetical protein